MFQIHQFPCLNDNYGFLAHDSVSGETAAIDTPDAQKYLAEAAARGWTITQIWNTHWHPDHAGGNLAIKEATGCTITGPAGEAAKIPGIDRAVKTGDVVSLGALAAHVIDVPGHTLGHIAYHLAGESTAFVGDAVFALGCGRVFAKFAVTVDPGNEALAAYVNEITDKRARNEWTVPTQLSRELKTNPFLRADDPGLQEAMGHPGDPVATFAEIRGRKDRF